MADRRIGVEITAEGGDLDKRLERARKAMDGFIKATDRADKASKGLESSQVRTAQAAVKTAQAARRVTTEEQKRAQAHRRAARTSRDAAAGTDALRRSVTRAIPKLAGYSSTLRRVSSLGTALAGALGARAVAQTARLEVALNLQAGAIGLAASEFRNLNTLYGALGSTGDRAAQQIFRVADAIEAARAGGKLQQQAFARLGVAYETVSGEARNAAEVMLELGAVAGSLGEVSTEALDAYRNIIGGREARTFLGIWRRSREEIETIQQTLSKADAAGEEYRKEWFNINFAIAQVKDSIAGLFLEAVGRNADTIIRIMSGFQTLAEFFIPRLVSALRFAADNARILLTVLLALAGYAVQAALVALVTAIVNITKALFIAIRAGNLLSKTLIRTGIGIAAVVAGYILAGRILGDVENELEQLEAELNELAGGLGGAGAAVAEQNPFWEQWLGTLQKLRQEVQFFQQLQTANIEGVLTVGPGVLRRRLDEMVAAMREAAQVRQELRDAWDEALSRAGLPTQADVDRITDMNQVMTTLGNSVSSTFASWATGATKARDAMRQLLAQIAQFFIRRQVFALLGRLGLIQSVPGVLQLPVGGGSTTGAQGFTVPGNATAGYRAAQGAGGVAGYAGPSTVVVQGVQDPHVVASQVASALQPLWRRDIATARGR